MRWSPQYWTAFAQKRITIQIDDMYFPVLHTCIELSTYVQQNLPAALWVFPSEWLPGLVSLPLQILLWAVIEGDLQQEHTWQEQRFMSNLAFAYSRPPLLKKTNQKKRTNAPPSSPPKVKVFQSIEGAQCFGMRDLSYWKIGIHDFGGTGRWYMYSGLSLWKGCRIWRFCDTEFGKCRSKEPISGKESQLN